MQTTRTTGSSLDRMMTLNRVIDHAFGGHWMNEQRLWIPAVDLIEREEAYLLDVELPGVREADIEIVFEQGKLTVRGTRQTVMNAAQESESRIYAAERMSGAFERSIRLPNSIDRDEIAAHFESGLLTVTLPKARTAQPRRIEVQTAAANTAPAAPRPVNN